MKNERERKTRDIADGCKASGLCATMHATRRKRKAYSNFDEMSFNTKTTY
jgi:hypothetical protein